MALTTPFRAVIVRLFGGGGAVRALLETTSRAAFVCRPEHASEIADGRRPAPMSGFPIEDVFEADPEAVAQIERGAPVSWTQLHPLKH